MKVINFMGQSTSGLAIMFSALLLIGSIVSLATRQLNWGLDFTGGTLIEVHYSSTADLEAIRGTLEKKGFAGKAGRLKWPGPYPISGRSPLFPGTGGPGRSFFPVAR